jgi:hypothetical protein
MPRAPTPAELRAELARRRAQEKKEWDPLDALLPHQRPVFLDKRPRRVYTGTRQLGKSSEFAVELIDAAVNNPGSESAYVDMTKDHADKVLWREIQRNMSTYHVPAKVVGEELHFDNGAKVYVFSGEPSEVAKLQGMKFAILIIDEAQDAPAINEILTMVEPALMRFNGRILLGGIPGRVKKIGPWWEICEGDQAGQYGQHRGTFWDNSALSEEGKQRLFEEAKNRLSERNPDFIRHWLGLWPELDFALRVYHYDPALNSYSENAPVCPLHSLGLDPGGVRDSEAVVIVGHGNTDGLIWHVDEKVTPKKAGGAWNHTDDETKEQAAAEVSADRVGALNEKWKPHKKYYDWGSAHKDALALIWNKTTTIMLEGVPSKSPYDEAQRINELFAQRRLFIKKGSKLEQDLMYTTWDEKSLGGGEQKPKYSRDWKQDAADALRCAMWAIWTTEPKERPIVRLTPEQAEAKRIADKVAYKKRKPESRQDKYRLPSALDRAPKPSVIGTNGRLNRGY